MLEDEEVGAAVVVDDELEVEECDVCVEEELLESDPVEVELE